MGVKIVDKDYYPLEHRKYLTLRELSQIYGIPYTTLQSWAARRIFPLYKVRGRIRVRARQFEEWFEKHYVKPFEKKVYHERPLDDYGSDWQKGHFRK